MRILLASADDTLVAALRAPLSELGHVVDVAPSIGALHARARTLHDLAIVDVSVPAASAREWLARVREAEPRASLLAVGRRFMLHERVLAAEGGAHVFLTMPFTRADLLAAVARAREAR